MLELVPGKDLEKLIGQTVGYFAHRAAGSDESAKDFIGLCKSYLDDVLTPVWSHENVLPSRLLPAIQEYARSSYVKHWYDGFRSSAANLTLGASALAIVAAPAFNGRLSALFGGIAVVSWIVRYAAGLIGRWKARSIAEYAQSNETLVGAALKNSKQVIKENLKEAGFYVR